MNGTKRSGDAGEFVDKKTNTKKNKKKKKNKRIDFVFFQAEDGQRSGIPGPEVRRGPFRSFFFFFFFFVFFSICFFINKLPSIARPLRPVHFRRRSALSVFFYELVKGLLLLSEPLD
eukprot:TRINITY_DN21400_c1_g1_i1.p2 TRINITY_DN21400_c1_g1~~TRINITY_DN21400_c1_g1_i1.p2  ORF type:complete len:117 (-),score=18.44 TRINITY_DN21400_c1_g1_i1:3-353(-)